VTSSPIISALSVPGNVRGMALMFVATMFFSAMHAAIRYYSAELHPFELAFFRNLFGLIVVLPWFIRHGLAPLRTQRLPLHGLRALLNLVGMLTFFYALSLIPLSRAAALSFSAPLFATVLAVLFLGEVVRARRWTAILFGFAGTMVVLRPGLESIGSGEIMMLMSSAVWACALMVIKSLTRTESTITITSYMLLLMVPLSAIPAALVWEWPRWDQLIWLAGIGMSGTIGQLLMTQALKEGETNVVMPLDFFKLIWAVLLGYLLLGEVPDMFTWIGGAMIFLGGTYIAYRESKLRAAANLKPPDR